MNRRCEVAQYATGPLEPVAPRCGRPARWSFEETSFPGGNSWPAFHACDDCAREIHLRSDVEGERLEVSS